MPDAGTDFRLQFIWYGIGSHSHSHSHRNSNMQMSFGSDHIWVHKFANLAS
jgi:hypothetical protein